tara:strand:+ start:1934 stop:3169 length:1236 start_codon:yes stop_codon:yes gene_type:complete
MEFNELEKIMHNAGIYTLAEISRELKVSPQSVSNWKSRNQIPYKYVLYIKKNFVYTQESAHIDSSNHNINNNTSFIVDGEINVGAVYRLLQNNKKRIFIFTTFFAFLGLFYALLSTPLYTSTVTMYPSQQESSGKLSQLTGMASSFGLDIGGPQNISIKIPDIVKSVSLKRNLIYNKWNTKAFINPVNLIEFWQINNSSNFTLNPIKWLKYLFDNSPNLYNESIWENIALGILSERIIINENASGLISISIIMEDPQLAADLTNFMYEAIVEFTTNVHSKHAILNREFIAIRKNEVNIALTDAENKLQEFRERNRSISDSPQLQIELERYIRDVQIQTQIYITLQQQYEIARIEEAKETPSVIVIDEGRAPIGKTHPKRKLIVFSSILIGILCSVLYIIIEKAILHLKYKY